MTIYDVRSAWIRRPLLVLTVLAIIVSLGPLHLIRAVCVRVLAWIEDEFEADLRDAWRGPDVPPRA